MLKQSKYATSETLMIETTLLIEQINHLLSQRLAESAEELDLPEYEGEIDHAVKDAMLLQLAAFLLQRPVDPDEVVGAHELTWGRAMHFFFRKGGLQTRHK